MLTVADVLARGLALPPLPEPPLPAPAGARCALTGAPISEGYPFAPLLQKSTAVILDVVRGPLDGWVSDAAARCWRSSGPVARLALGGLVFEDGAAYQGRIALAGRDDPARGCWRDIVRAVWPARRGQRLVWILTTDTKRRLWTGARVGPLGEATPVLLCDADTQASLTVSWPRLLACLEAVESVYARGFAKGSIRDGLLSAFKLAESWGIADALAWDRRLAPWRGTAELAVALLVAQRETLLAPEQRPAPPLVAATTSAAEPTPAPADAAPARAGIVQGSLF